MTNQYPNLHIETKKKKWRNGNLVPICVHCVNLITGLHKRKALSGKLQPKRLNAIYKKVTYKTNGLSTAVGCGNATFFVLVWEKSQTVPGFGVQFPVGKPYNGNMCFCFWKTLKMKVASKRYIEKEQFFIDGSGKISHMCSIGLGLLLLNVVHFTARDLALAQCVTRNILMNNCSLEQFTAELK